MSKLFDFFAFTFKMCIKELSFFTLIKQFSQILTPGLCYISMSSMLADFHWFRILLALTNGPHSNRFYLFEMLLSSHLGSIRTAYILKNRKENAQKLSEVQDLIQDISWGKRTAQKDTIIDTTSDSQVNSNLPYRWSPASLTFNNYFYLFLYLYITSITINNNTPHLKSPKNRNKRAALGRLAMKLQGASTSLRSTDPRP